MKMFMAFMAVLVICSALLLGGKLQRFTTIRLRHPWLIMLALITQILITDVVPGAPRALLITLHLATYAAAAAILWANRSLPGLIVLGIGAMTNAIVIALNRGTLPASAHALAAAGLPVQESNFANSSVVAHPILPWLGDILATPAWLPFRNVISIGDLIILLGALLLVHGVSRSQAWALCARLTGRGNVRLGSGRVR